MSSSSDAARIETLVRKAVDAFRPDLGVRLWTGERLGPQEGPCIAIRDVAALAELALAPRIDTAVQLWTSGRLDIEDGSIFDIADRRSPVKPKDALRRLGKRRIAAALPALWRIRRAAKREALAQTGADAGASGSTKAAIQFHYDVSNDFYRLFLDERMVYSCAYFTEWHDDIDRAQRDKLEMICRKLRLQSGDRMLDIGCGWGALLIHAATHHGVTGHGVTLSQAQFDLAQERIRAAGLEDRITIELKPFQELTGTFDKISSIGMFEHVGFANHDAYFATVKRLLRPRGLYLHHTIARPAKKSLKAFMRGGSEYRAITRYIFPGGELDYIGHSLQKLEANRFEVHDVENWREHYGRTCRLWAERLRLNFAEAAAEVGEPRARLWLLYLAGCALAFERGTVMINQTLASRRDKGPSGLPPTRADLYR
ncbi:SAM-dependent methyltransferase [Aureimonas jatrophae]|uniref:Cyclopropane-fatty-acyl-phospholipid synthase n=1 Tax=Aureimonas jatrophae TaxID=1166073 RepID=A0A1H0K8R8_9HYPH|nr:cyclopropane-fatty-acyl-phospholipid synthase family protein [Aureimonas jatrophae]MBB3951001.1 cyclopropane-fatty-acyl-phospholipid synthase [Aureimonas jatrophae]SDO52284.1 cyclopropane-fatty-acyl-phospholipid synthase [Aureimonas jatrophae]